MNGIGTLVETATESSLTLEKTDICEPGNRFSPDTESSGTLTLDWCLHTVRKTFLLYVRYSVYGML